MLPVKMGTNVCMEGYDEAVDMRTDDRPVGSRLFISVGNNKKRTL